MLGSNANQDERDCWNTSPFADEIVKLPFVISDAGGHFLLQLFHGEDFIANIDDIANEERHVLDEQVISDKRIFAELYLDGDSFLHKISLVI